MDSDFIQWHKALKRLAVSKGLLGLINDDLQEYKESYYEGVSIRDEIDFQMNCII